MPIVADAAVAVRGDMSKFAGDIKQGAAKPIQGLGAQIKSTLNPSALIGGGIALIGGAVVAGLAGAVKALIDIERLNAQTDATIKSTGGAANVTREQVEELAEAAERTTTIERESVQAAANMLLTFTRVRNEVGNGNDIFDQATEAALDMSVALGTDATGAAMLLGKALNDPVRGMTAMTRAGIQFTDQQKDMIASMVASGDLLGAQQIILAELETQFGGSAEAFANTTAGRVQRFQNDIGNFFEGIILGAGNVTDEVGDAAGLIAIHFGDMGDRANRLADNMGISFEELKNQIRTQMAETGETVDAALASIEEEFNETASVLPVSMQATMDSIAGTIYGGAAVMVQAAEDALSRPLIVAMLGGQEEAERIAGETPGGIAEALLARQFEVEDAAAQLANVMEQALHPVIERANIIGFLTSQGLADGLNDERPAVRIAAQELKDAAEARLLELDGWSYGNRAGLAFAAGLNAAYGVVRDAAGNLAAATRNQIGINSEPSDHNSPLYGVTKWGGNIARTIADGIYGELGMASSAAGSLAAALTPTIGPVGMNLAAANGAAGGGDTYLQLVVEGKPKTVGSANEMWSGFEQLAGFSDRSMT